MNNLDSRGTIYPGQLLRLKAVESVAVANTSTITEPDVALVDVRVEDETKADESSAINAGEQTIEDIDTMMVDTVATAVEVDDADDAQQLLADLQSDPSDYTVASDNSIEIQAAETLGHYAEWLGIRAWDIRRQNNMVYKQPVLIGERLKLDFSKVNVAEFELKRRQFHRSLQSDYFKNWRIKQTEQHSIRRGDFLVNLARKRSVPMWLFRQYNPEVEAARIQIGQVVVFPVVERVDI